MAASVAARGTSLAGSFATDGAANIPVPPGMVAGQVALVFVYNQSNNAVSPAGTYASSLFELTPFPSVPTSNSKPTSLHVFWHAAASNQSVAETGTYNFTWTESGSDRWDAGVAIRITGADTTDPIDVFASAALTSSSVNGPQVQVTPTGTNRLLIWAGSNYDGATWGPAEGSTWNGSPTGFIMRVNDSAGAVGVASRDWPTQTASGLTRGVASTSSTQTAWLIAINPGVVAPTISAGADATITLGDTFTRSISVTDNGGGTILSQGWSIIAAPAGVSLISIDNDADLAYTPTVAGTYTLRANAMNSAGTGTDDVVLTVNAPPGPPPGRFLMAVS